MNENPTTGAGAGTAPGAGPDAAQESGPLAPGGDPTQGPVQGNGAGDEKATLLATLAVKREEAKADHWLDLPIPGYDNLMYARFRPFPVEKTERKMAEFQKLAGKQPLLLKSACDTLIDACEQVMLLPARFDGDIGDQGQNLIPIDDDAMPPIAFDERLAHALNFKADTARQVVLGLFATEQAVIAMNIMVSRWMQDVTRKTDEALLGE